MISYILTRNVDFSLPSIIKYCYILLCFFLSMLIEDNCYDTRDKRLLQTALFLTTIADFFFIILESPELGIFMFIFVQISYIVRHSRTINLNATTIKILVLLSSAMLFLGIFLKPKNIDTKLYYLALLYGTILINSFILAFSTLRSRFYYKHSSLMIALGIALFFMCDINVGLYPLITEYYNIDSLSMTIYFLIWFFYLPSQLLLALSGYRKLK
nr:lysoplasmalogenase family protein [Clostridium fungisolvens]